MARGWESKSVEDQIDVAQRAPRVEALENSPGPEQLEFIRRRESILLSRTRVERELNSAQNPRYRALMTKALAELDAQLSAFGGR